MGEWRREFVAYWQLHFSSKLPGQQSINKVGEKIYFFSSFWMTTDRALSVQQCISKQNTIQFGVITCFIALVSLDTMISQTTGWGCSAIAYYVFPFLLWIVVFVIDLLNRSLFTLQVCFLFFHLFHTALVLQFFGNSLGTCTNKPALNVY